MTLHVESAGAGAPLVLLHGWGFHSSVWNGFADDLAQRHRVHRVDLPGHGHSRDERLGSLDETADAIAALVPAASIVCGWSLGGLIAQRMAERHPGKVRALALVATTPCFTSRDDWPHGIGPEALDEFAQGLRDDPGKTLATFIHLNAFNVPAARVAIRGIAQSLAERRFASAQALDAGLEMLRTADLRSRGNVPVIPTRVIHGVRDRIVPIGAGRWLARTAPLARLVELEASSHLPFVTDRAAVVEAIESLDG